MLAKCQSPDGWAKALESLGLRGCTSCPARQASSCCSSSSSPSCTAGSTPLPRCCDLETGCSTGCGRGGGALGAVVGEVDQGPREEGSWGGCHLPVVLVSCNKHCGPQGVGMMLLLSAAGLTALVWVECQDLVSEWLGGGEEGMGRVLLSVWPIASPSERIEVGWVWGAAVTGT